MRICLVSREFPGFVSGGIGTYVAEMARAYAAHGHEVHVLTQAHEGLREQGAKVAPGAHMHGVTLDTPHMKFEAYATWHQRYNMASSELLASLHAKVAFDYIEFPDYWGEGYFPLMAKRTGGAYAGTVLGVRLHSPTFLALELNKMFHVSSETQHLHHMEVESVRWADMILSPSESLLAIMQARAPAARGVRRYEAVQPYPLDPRPLDEAAAGGGESAGDGTPEILYYGRLEGRKGVVELVRAGLAVLAGGADVRFRLIGGDTESGPFGRSMREHLVKLTRGAHEGRFVFEQSRPRVELAGAIRRAHACCFPSIWENFPNVCMEAMCLGAVVIGSRDGGMSQMINDGRSGLLVAGGDEDALAGAIRRVLAMQGAERRAMGSAARAGILAYCDGARVVRDTLAHVARAGESAGVATRDADARWTLVKESARGGGEAGCAKSAWDGLSRRSGHVPRVSIIVPFYNLGEYLPATLASVQRQTFRDYEVIIVNDGSTEEAGLKVLASLRAKGVHVIDQRNGGLSNARNTAINAARGEWILPLDADDLLHERALERLVEARVRNPEAALATCLVRYFDAEPEKPIGGWIPFGLDADILSIRNCGGTPLSLMDRAMLAEIRYDEWLTAYEDWDMYCSLAERGAFGVVVPEFLFYYRVRPQSMLRVDGIPKHDQLRSYLHHKHPRLARDPEYVTRMLFGEHLEQRLQIAWYENERLRLMGRISELEGKPVDAKELAAPTSLEQMADMRARAMIEENIRYRMADKVNDLLKSMGIKDKVKAMVPRGGANGDRAIKR